METIDAGALSGLKVLDLGRMVAAPYCAMMLASMGADVIKIEDPAGGDISRESMPQQNGVSTYYMAYNCGKTGISVNLKTSAGKEILKKLISQADVLIENFRPGVMERLGFGYGQAAEINPGIIYASISGYGQKGPLAGRAAFDPIAQAMSGMVSITGTDKDHQVRCGASIADVLSGQNAAFAILAALRYREKTGRGQHIDIALADSCISAMSSVNQIFLSTGRVPAPLGNGFEASAPGNAYRTRDGRVMILAGRNNEWKKLALALGHSEWLDDPRFLDTEKRLENRALLDDLIESVTVNYSTSELMALLLGAKLPVGEILTIEQVTKNDHFSKERKMFIDFEDPVAGKVCVTNLPIRMSVTPPQIHKRAPILGEDNRRILHELGYSDSEMKKLLKDGVI